MTLEIKSAAEFNPMEPGAWRDVPMSQYHAAPGYSNSQLKLLAENPEKFHAYMLGKYRITETKDMQIGTVIHAVVAGTDVSKMFHERPEVYACGEKKWNGHAKECKEWLEDHSDKPIFTSADALTIRSIDKLARSNKKLTRLVQGAHYEISMTARNPGLDYPFMLRFRPDVFGCDSNGYWILDNKSTRDASTDAFSREIAKRGYHVQMALYKRAFEALTKAPVRIYINAIEKSGEFSRMNLRQLSERALEKGSKELDSRLDLMRRCRIANNYPAFPDHEDTDAIQVIDLPDYLYEADEMLEGMEDVTTEE